MYVFGTSDVFCITDDPNEAPEDAIYIEKIPEQPLEGNWQLRFNPVRGEVFWVEVIERKVEIPLDDITLLKAQNQALADRTEFLEDCIAEMAVEVYGGV